MSVKSKHSASKKDKTGKKEKKKKESDEEIESSEEELDLTKECHPIGYYINDRPEMINQMFSVIKGNKLKAMLPPILKEIDLEQLKLECLDQLLGMSEKRITCILEGGTLETSSESEVLESDEYESDEKNGTSCSSSEKFDEHHPDSYLNETKLGKRKGGSVSGDKAEKIAKNNLENAPAEQGKTLLELLELEMRARAIRALLKQSGNEKANEQNIEQETDEVNIYEADKNDTKDVTSEIVDLTECDDEELPAHVKEENCDETTLCEKMLTCDKKIEKSKTDKLIFPKENEKSKKWQAEFELRNRLFKKKIYRTRQQRMDSEEDDKNNETNELDSDKNTFDLSISNKGAEIVIKQEPVEQNEIVIEDPEEGEISTSEDEYPVEVKQEIIESVAPEENVNSTQSVDYNLKIAEDAERVTAIDNGTFVSYCSSEIQSEKESEKVDIKESPGNGLLTPGDTEANVENTAKKRQENESVISHLEEPSINEETSWRDRWLQKDGVQKLVKSSKIYAKVKKRIAEKSQKAKEDSTLPQEPVIDPNSNSKIEVIEGSIKEYEKLISISQDHKRDYEIIKTSES